MVSSLDRLRSEFSDVGFISGSEFYIRAGEAAAYLNACAQHGLVILGMEAFELHGDKLKPRLDLIADFSGLLDANTDWAEASRASQREALRFLTNVANEDSDIVINVVAIEKEESAQV